MNDGGPVDVGWVGVAVSFRWGGGGFNLEAVVGCLGRVAHSCKHPQY